MNRMTKLPFLFSIQYNFNWPNQVAAIEFYFYSHGVEAWIEKDDVSFDRHLAMLALPDKN
ncbi:MAG TPA: hypothetical protein VMW01_07285 [Williamwhitmania sp.]|nr:hypothetical protein [Williamwhitmania sp.]